MLIILYILTGLAFLAVIVTLIFGAAAMTRKTDEARTASNKWMWRRIYAQLTAIILLVLTFYVKSRGA